MASVVAATLVQKWGAFAFGVVVGWVLYFLNRYRKDVGIGDLATIIGAVGGGAVLTLFPASSELFAWYGLGLASGFFLYFIVLLILVRASSFFTIEFILDGRRLGPDGKTWIMPEEASPVRQMLTFDNSPELAEAVREAKKRTRKKGAS